jgi:hypothetical protein
MHLSTITYNLKKYLKFTSKVVRSDAKSLLTVLIQNIDQIWGEISWYKHSKNIEMRSEKKFSLS